MGNFYTNLVVAADESDRAVAVLEKAKRTAYVAVTGGRTFVYDEACEKQNLDELRDLAKLLSDEVGAPVMAALNHDDDVLWLGLAERGAVTDVYNSDPGYFEDGDSPPEIRDVARLCSAFGVPQRSDDFTKVLEASRDEFAFEVDRHAKLLDLLDVSTMGLAGFNYIYEDGPSEPGVTVEVVGDAG